MLIISSPTTSSIFSYYMESFVTNFNHFINICCLHDHECVALFLDCFPMNEVIVNRLNGTRLRYCLLISVRDKINMTVCSISFVASIFLSPNLVVLFFIWIKMFVYAIPSVVSLTSHIDSLLLSNAVQRRY